jgi:hypothetical protein
MSTGAIGDVAAAAAAIDACCAWSGEECIEKMGVGVCACRTGRGWRIGGWWCGTRIFGTGLGVGLAGRPSRPETKALDGLGAADLDESKGEPESKRLMRLEGIFAVEVFTDEEAYEKNGR